MRLTMVSPGGGGSGGHTLGVCNKIIDRWCPVPSAARVTRLWIDVGVHVSLYLSGLVECIDIVVYIWYGWGLKLYYRLYYYMSFALRIWPGTIQVSRSR